MPLRLYGKQLHALGPTSDRPFVVRVVEPSAEETRASDREAFLSRDDHSLPDGFRAYLCHASRKVGTKPDVYALGEEMHYLKRGDVIRIDPRRGVVRVLYRRDSSFNSLLVTERCDNYCVMCSQPPKERDDSWLVDELMFAIPLMSPETQEIGITGGEPGLLRDRLVDVLRQLQQHLPRTGVHVLSNGRAFADPTFARKLAALRHPDLMIGIPLYSDLAEEHDYVVQARGAYSETIRGILNLKQAGVPVEIRVVIHEDTFRRLPDLARFIERNLLFVDHVAWMGLELVGFAKANLAPLWVDPVDYQRELTEAVRTVSRAGMRVSIYNHQLCVLDERLHKFARKSISDWKNDYFEECVECHAQAECAGFFVSSAAKRSRGIRPVVRR